jgi:hypothetical protein
MVRQIGRSAIRTSGWPEARVRQPAYRLRQRPHLQGIDLNRAAGEIVNLVDRNGSAVERMQGHRGNCSRRRFDRIPWPSDPLPGSRPDRAPASRSCAGGAANRSDAHSAPDSRARPQATLAGVNTGRTCSAARRGIAGVRSTNADRSPDTCGRLDLIIIAGPIEG